MRRQSFHEMSLVWRDKWLCGVVKSVVLHAEVKSVRIWYSALLSISAADRYDGNKHLQD